MIATVLLAAPAVAVVLALIAFSRTGSIRDLNHRVQELERALHRALSADQVPNLTAKAGEQLSGSLTPSSVEDKELSRPQVDGHSDASAPEVVAAHPDAAENHLSNVSETVAAGDVILAPGDPHKSEREGNASDPAGWESFIGQKAFGWLAALLFILSAAFFLKYAFQNNWIGPVGRVATGELIGALLVYFGWTYFHRGMHRFSGMLTSTGIVVLYLSTYSAFGFYRLLPQSHAGLFLAVLILESMVAAVLYRSSAVAMVSVLGGLLTPILLGSDHDDYSSFFCYLLLLNAGVAVALLMRSWAVVGSVAFAGTQWLFWMWYGQNYHPDKFAWAMGFQSGLFAVYTSQSILSAHRRKRPSGLEELARYAAVPLLFFLAIRVLAAEKYNPWMGVAACSMALIYAALGQLLLKRRAADQRMLLTSLSIAVGFSAWAVPLQADARWISLGWAAMGTALWWFGLRISALPLRGIAGVLSLAAAGRLVLLDLPRYTRDPFFPVFNSVALPSIGVAFSLLLSVWLADAFLKSLQKEERFLIGLTGVIGVLLLWLVLSYDCFGYFVSQAVRDGDISLWQWRGQLALTVLWTCFATTLLVAGFRLQRARLRWFAMVLFGVTVVKLFIVDMANVQQLYRILAFFVLAVVLGLVARAYQKFR